MLKNTLSGHICRDRPYNPSLSHPTLEKFVPKFVKLNLNKQLPMRKIIFQMAVSLDGYFEGPNKEFDWHNVDEQFNLYAIDFLQSVDLLLFGRTTFQMMEAYWTTREAKEDDPIVAEKMNSLPKIVFSKHLREVTWENSKLVSENVDDEIRRLKKMPGKNIAILGASDFAVSIIPSGLIDEFRIMVCPVVLGGGKTLLSGIQARLPLRLDRTEKFPSGNIMLFYHPA